MEVLTVLFSLSLAFWPSTLAAPLKAHESGGAEHIVLIRNDMDLPPRVEAVMERLALHDKHPDVRRVFNNSAFTGFSATMKSHCLEQLAEMTDVSLVEAATDVPRADTRMNAPWGLQRISSKATIGGNSDELDYTYSFTNNKLGHGADIYMIDTGIYVENNIFKGRAKMIWSFDGIMTDNDGHGTHTAGTAGGDILGVASNANVFGIKALDKDGGSWSSDVVGAIDAVINFHDQRKKHPDFLGSVLSMSLAASGNVGAISSAVEAAVKAGVHSVVAAGNDNDNACNASPASSGGKHGPAITVGAIDQDTNRAKFSNYGPCVDVYAPGVQVISSWVGGPNMINSLSGTSMATPHVTGIVAYAMANSTLANNPALMKEWISMTALQRSEDMLVANNGFLSQNSQDKECFVGREKQHGRPSFHHAKQHRPVPTACKKFDKRAFSGLDSLMGCERSVEGGPQRGAWLCNAKKWIDDYISQES